MSLPDDFLSWRVGLIGYGEVGRILAEDLRARGVSVSMFDVKLGTRAGNAPGEHATRHGVRIASGHAPLAAEADLLVSAVTASQAVAAAQACASGLAAGSFFLDFNSASPGAKTEAAALVERAGGRYVEGAVMSSVPPHRIGVPLLLGGLHAGALLPALQALGFSARIASTKLGVASATKMCRSVIVKGLEALVIESFTAARAYGVEDEVLASLQETFPGIRWNEQGTYFFQRAIAHGRRRAEEMREAAQTVREAGLDPCMARATAARQESVADLADAGAFGGRAAPRSGWRVEAECLLAAARAAAPHS